MIQVTPKQLELLALYASGYNIQEIASLKYMSIRTVEDNFASARRRAGAKTLTNLCVMCLESGLIERRDEGFRPVYDPEIVGE